MNQALLPRITIMTCLVEVSRSMTVVCLSAQEYKRKQLEEQRQSERLQRQLQQEHAYLVSLQQQQQEKKPQLYHYNKNLEPNNKPTWAREVAVLPQYYTPQSSRRTINRTVSHPTPVVLFSGGGAQ